MIESDHTEILYFMTILFKIAQFLYKRKKGRKENGEETTDSENKYVAVFFEIGIN
ncbi:MAG: hypothetical protein QNJ36_17520 [Calothrix sp. MO_167.B42]|nr:hypothetical protein [Calothrix sp. MO_167.B42]